MRHMLRSIVTAAVVLTFLAASSAVAQPPSDAEVVSAVDELVAKALTQPGAVGFSVAIARGDKIILAKGYGHAELEHDVAANADTMFRIGSITKQYTAAAMMKLVEQGKVSLDDDMRKYLPDYPTGDHTVTIRHLLNHTSGISSYTEDGEFMRTRTPLDLTHEQMLAEFKDDPFDFAPGENWNYNNSGYYLLGMIIEKITGKSYGDHLQEEFFAPLNLNRTRYDSSWEVIKDRAQGYRMSPKGIANDAPIGMSIPGAAGAIIASAQDLVKWQIALVGGQVVSVASYEQMCTPTILPNGESTNYGFGLQTDEYRDHPVIAHGGGIFGFNSMMSYFPEHQLHIAVISNSQAARAGTVLDSIANVALGLKPEEIHDLDLTAAQMKRYVGTYLIEGSLKTDIFERDGQLFAQAAGQDEFRLLPQGNHEFRAAFNTEVKVVFDGEGEASSSFVLHQGGRATAKRVD